MNKKLLVLVLLSFSIFFFDIEAKEKAKTIRRVLEHDEETLLPLLWLFPALSRGSRFPEFDLKNKLHPLNLGVLALTFIKEGFESQDQEMLIEGKKSLNFLADEYPLKSETDSSIVWQYNFQHGELKAGWWSAMANSVIAVAFLAGYEVWGNEKYRILAIKAMNGAVLPVDEGGSALWLDDRSCWFFEYAHSDINKENGYYVLNGFLVTLHALRLFAQAVNSKKHFLMYEAGMNGLKKMHNKFHYEDGRWTYYKLNPPGIEQARYNIFDMVCYSGLYFATQDTFFLDELKKRRSIFKKGFPIFFCSQNNVNTFLFSTVGPPHPYLRDIYETRIEFFNSQGNKLNVFKNAVPPKNFKQPIKIRGSIHGIVEDGFYKYKVFCNKYGRSFLLYDGLVEESGADPCRAEVNTLSFNLSCYYDAECRDQNHVLILPPKMSVKEDPDYYANNVGVITLKLSKPIDRRRYKYFGLLIKPSVNIQSPKVGIVDSIGRSAYRSYLALKKGENNLILLNWSGFPGINNLSDRICKIVIRVYTKQFGSNVQKIDIRLQNVLLFENEVNLIDYFEKGKFQFTEK